MGSAVRVWLAVGGLLLAIAGPWPTLAQQQHQQQQQQSHDDNQLEATAGADRLPNCLIRCSLAANTRPNIDQLAHDMTNQIVAEIGSGQLTQQQLREPHWFEHRVTAQLNRQQQLERENVQKFYTLLGGAEESQRLREQQEFDLQQQLQRNLFQQPRFGQFIAQSQQQQQQQQHGSSQFQQQHTQNTFYAQPHYVIHAGQPQQSREERRQQTSVYTRQEQQPQPQPILTIQPQQTREERRQQTSTYSRQEQQPQPQPIVTIQPQQTREERRQQTSVYTRQEQQPQPQRIVTIQPQQTREERRQQTSVYTRQEHRPQPVVHIRPAPTVTTVNESTRTEDRRTNQQNAAPTTVIQIPAQETRRQRIQQQRHRIESQRAASPALIYVQSRPQTSTVVRNVTTVEERQTRLPQTHVYWPADDDKYYVHHSQRYEQRRVQPAANPVVVHIPAPVRTEQRHSIYRHLTQNAETQVPDYQPQWRVEHTAETLRRLEQQQQHAWRQPQQPVVVVVAPTTTTTTTTDSEIIEHTQRIAGLRNDLRYYAIRPFSEQQLNSSVRTGHFWDGTQLYVFNSTSGHFLPAATGNQQRESTVVTTVNDSRTLVPLSGVQRNEQLTRHEYSQRTHQLVAALRKHGYTSAISDQMIEEIVRRGGYAHNGVRYVWLGGKYVEETEVQVQSVDEEQHRQVAATEATHTTQVIVEETIETADETHERRLHELHAQLRAIGAADFGEFERNQTLQTGVFIRHATLFTYDNGTRRYVGERLTERDVQRIYERLQQLLRHYGYRETTHRETANMLEDGGFCRGGWRWVYEWRSGALTQTERTASQTEELSEAEYRAIYERIQETLRRLGYGAMTERQCNATVVSGTFDRGGIVYRLDVEHGTFVHDELERDAYEARVQVLRELQRAIGLRALSDAEVHSIIYRGHFVQHGHRYEYNPATRHYEQLDVSAAEYEELLQRLRQQLVDIGYEHMSVVECNQTIYTGEFVFNGYDWVYRYDTQEYARSDEQRPTDAPAPFPQETIYSLVTEAAPAAPSTEEWLSSTTHRPIISSNRGDQPPQVFVDDYSVEAVGPTEAAEPAPEPLPQPVETGTQVEQEPGVGYYPVTAVTEASIVEQYATPTVTEATARSAPVRRAPEEVRQDPREEVEQEEQEEEGEEEGGDEGDDNGDEYEEGEEGADEEF